MTDPDKDIDLHESEWSHEKKREPFWGPNYWAVYAIAALIAVLYFIKSNTGEPAKRCYTYSTGTVCKIPD